MRNAPRMKLPMFKDDQRLLRGGVELTYPMDGLAADLHHVYGTIPLLSSYSGPVLRARRADGAVSDFYWLPYYPFLRNTSFASILTWAGGQNATVSMWYCQKDNVDTDQPSVGSQPNIVSGGVVALDPLGFPAISFDGVNDHFLLTEPDILQNVPGATLGHLAEKNNASTVYLTLFGGATGQIRSAVNFGSNFASEIYRILDADANTNISSGVISQAWHRVIGRARYTDGAGDISVDGVVTSGSGGTAGNSENIAAANAGRIGSSFGANFMTGKMSRVVIAKKSIDLATLDAALNG